MKLLSMFLLSFGISGLVIAQRPVSPVVSATKMNVVYRGIPNPIDVAVPGRTWDELEVSVDSTHTWECLGEGSFVLTPSTDQRIRSVEVQVQIPNALPEEQILLTREFRIKRIPNPSLFWAGKTPTDKYITKAEVLSLSPVAARMEGFDFEVQLRVVTFWLGVERQGVFKYFQSDTNRLTEDMKSILRAANKGDRIWIGNAMVSIPDGTERELPPLLLTLKG